MYQNDQYGGAQSKGDLRDVNCKIRDILKL